MSHKTYAHATCQPLDITDVAIAGGFWKRIVDQSRRVALPAVLTEYENRNIVKNFIDTAAGRPRAEKENGGNYDEFLFKALEACNYYLREEGTGETREQYERIRDIVLAIQEADGYLNTHAAQLGTPHHSEKTIQELYAGGHLMQAGIAERRVTDNTILFDAAKRYIDCLVEGYGLDGAGLNRHGQDKWPDHPNIEPALVELYRETGDTRYLTFCNSVLNHGEYRERTQMVNHAVCEPLCCTGATDYYLETGDQEVWEATQRLWADMLKKIYVTGGLGSTHRGTTRESVGKEFALTNDQAYAETCAAISMVFWSWRMFLATGAAEYVDMLERALYNGVLAGVSLDGCDYFYENPLEYRAVCAKGSASQVDWHAEFRGDLYTRKAYHGCSCCPPNVQRLFASLQQYVYAVRGSELWVNLFAGSKLSTDLPDGVSLTLLQETDYPWSGLSRFAVTLDAETAFTLRIRVPGWCRGVRIAVNGDTLPAEGAGARYVSIERTWRDGDSVEVDFAMPGRLDACHPKNTANYAKVVIARGPIVYCLEGHDNPGTDIFAVEISPDTTFGIATGQGVLEGLPLLETKAIVRDDSEWDAGPYRPLADVPTPSRSPVRIRAIPYFAWANRGQSDMTTAFAAISPSGNDGEPA